MANTVLYGFLEHRDIFRDQLNAQNIEVVNTAIQASVDEHNRQMNALNGLFVEVTTEYKKRFKQMSSHKLQPLDDNGRALPVKAFGYYDMAWPIQQAGTAWGANYVASKKMTVEDANNITLAMLEADIRWMRQHLMAALFSNTTWTFSDDQWGDLTVGVLANNDTVKYQIISGNDAPATDNHFYGQANAINDGADNPFVVGKDELMEHPENSGNVIALISSSLKADTLALDTFYEKSDPNIRLGSGLSELTGSIDVAVPGEMLGYDAASGVWISEWKSLPAGYGIMVCTGGERPLRQREDPEDVLRGFNRVADRNDHPFYESQWLRRAGFGAWNRVGAFVFEASDASYDVPTGYAAPIG